MYISKKEKEDYERRFNGYIMKIIKNEYIRYSKVKAKEERIKSLNDFDLDGVECIQKIIGDTDICFEEFFAPEELELVFEDYSMYKAVKSLTRKEKLAIFLCFILEMKNEDVAEILEVKHTSVRKICTNGISKIKAQLNKTNGGGAND